MQGYWIKFKDGSAGYCEGQTAWDAKRIAQHVSGKEVDGSKWGDEGAEVIPYPATPIIWQFDHPVSGKCPAFCYDPAACKGHTSCPKSYACSE